MKALVIDPGTSHLQATVFELDAIGNRIEELYSECFSPKKRYLNIINCGQEICKIAIHFNVEVMLIEYQAAFGSISTVRWNTFVQGIIMTMITLTFPISVIEISPSSAKRRLKLAKGSYLQNKAASIDFYNMYFNPSPKEKSDHKSDCFILAYYYKHCLRNNEEEMLYPLHLSESE